MYDCNTLCASGMTCKYVRGYYMLWVVVVVRLFFHFGRPL